MADPASAFANLVFQTIPCYRDWLVGLACLVLGFAGALIVLHAPPLRTKLMDCPTDRSSHEVPTARGGGVGIFLAFVLAGMAYKIPTTFLFSAIMMAVLSFYGEYVSLSVKARIILHFIAAAVLFFPLFPKFASAVVATSSPPASLFLMGLLFCFFLVFIVGTTNFYNFMDGINGIAGISAMVGFGLLSVFLVSGGASPAMGTRWGLLALCIVLACLGFLPLNFPRARIFLGDIGSILLGFLFAGMIVVLAGDLFDVICLASCLFPFYADALTTMAIRLRRGENLTEPHRLHLYQLLANEGRIPHWKVSLSYGLAQLAIGCVVLLARSHGKTAVFVSLIIFSGLFVIITLKVRRSIHEAPAFQ